MISGITEHRDQLVRRQLVSPQETWLHRQKEKTLP